MFKWLCVTFDFPSANYGKTGALDGNFQQRHIHLRIYTLTCDTTIAPQKTPTAVIEEGQSHLATRLSRVFLVATVRCD
jgi:hypothetical protein